VPTGEHLYDSASDEARSHRLAPADDEATFPTSLRGTPYQRTTSAKTCQAAMKEAGLGPRAGLAQLVEQMLPKHQVTRSSRVARSTFPPTNFLLPYPLSPSPSSAR
jgi:hypothetical protein